MKRIFTLFFMIIAVFAFAGCTEPIDKKEGNDDSKLPSNGEIESNVTNESYKLTVNDNNDLLYEKLNDSYKAGEKITVKVGIIYDAGVEVYLDNKTLGFELFVQDDNGGHWEYYFTMPEHDATITLRVYAGFKNYNAYVEKYLPSDELLPGTQEEIVYNYLFNYLTDIDDDAKGYIMEFYGHYNDIFVVMMDTTVTSYLTVVGEETIDGVRFTYPDSNRILAYKSGDFYRLQDAFDNGLLTHDDLISIKHFNENEVYYLEEILKHSINDISKVELSINGPINKTNLLSARGQSDFLKFINTQYVKITEENLVELNNELGLEIGIFYCYKIYLDQEEIAIVPITTFDYAVIIVDDDIYISCEKIVLDSTLFETSEKEFVSSKMTIELASEIKLAYAKANRTETGPITLSELDRIKIRHYQGCFNGYHIVMIDGYYAYTQAIRSDVIGGVTIDYADGNALLAYKDQTFISLKDAFAMNYLTELDLIKISELHKASKAYDIIIDEYTEKKLCDLIKFDLYKFFSVFDEKNNYYKKVDALLSDYQNSQLLQRILSSPYELLNDNTIIMRELQITLSSNKLATSSNSLINFYLADNVNYSSIKKELIVDLDGIEYIVHANRSDLLELYNYLINLNYDSLVDKEYYQLSKVLPVLNEIETIKEISILTAVDLQHLPDFPVEVNYFIINDQERIGKLAKMLGEYSAKYNESGAILVPDYLKTVTMTSIIIKTNDSQYKMMIMTNHSTWVEVNGMTFMCDEAFDVSAISDVIPSLSEKMTREKFYNTCLIEYIENKLNTNTLSSIIDEDYKYLSAMYSDSALYYVFDYDLQPLKDTDFFKRILDSTYREINLDFRYVMDSLKFEFLTNYFATSYNSIIYFNIAYDITSSIANNPILLMHSTKNPSKYYKVIASEDDINSLYEYITTICSNQLSVISK